MHVRQRQHVILPNHIHVPESERTKLSFGSFGAGFGVSTGTFTVPDSEKSSTPLSETSQDIEEIVEEQSSRFVIFLVHLSMNLTSCFIDSSHVNLEEGKSVVNFREWSNISCLF